MNKESPNKKHHKNKIIRSEQLVQQIAHFLPRYKRRSKSSSFYYSNNPQIMWVTFVFYFIEV